MGVRKCESVSVGGRADGFFKGAGTSRVVSFPCFWCSGRNESTSEVFWLFLNKLSTLVEESLERQIAVVIIEMIEIISLEDIASNLR